MFLEMPAPAREAGRPLNMSGIYKNPTCEECGSRTQFITFFPLVGVGYGTPVLIPQVAGLSRLSNNTNR